jgi:hypothetical protein
MNYPVIHPESNVRIEYINNDKEDFVIDAYVELDRSWKAQGRSLLDTVTEYDILSVYKKVDSAWVPQNFFDLSLDDQDEIYQDLVSERELQLDEELEAELEEEALENYLEDFEDAGWNDEDLDALAAYLDRDL